MGFHFDAQGEVGVARSKSPKVQGQSYNYHGFLYSLSIKESHDSGQKSRLSLSAKKRAPVPPRQSSLPALTPSSIRQDITRTSPSAGLSVSSMDSVLPLQLRAGVKAAGFDFSSWIESTIDELRHPFNGNNPAHNSRSPFLADVPWMQEEQDATFSRLRPLKYRETAVYSDPGSAVVSFPYCGCEGLASSQYHGHGRSAGAEVDSIRPPSPLFSKNNSPRCSGDTLVDLSDSRIGEGCPDTFGRVRSASAQSNVSQKSQEEHASEAPWMKPLPSPPSDIGIPRIGDIISPTVFSPSTTEGCPSMPCTPGFVLDAHTARLSSAKASIVEVPSTAPSGHIASCIDDEAKLPSPAPSPPILQPLRMDYFPPTNSPGVNPMDTPLEPRSMGERRRLARASTSPAMTPGSSQLDPTSPLWGISRHSPTRQNSDAKLPRHGRKLSASAIAGIVADITASVQEFPAKMLCLDTPCIVAIRHDMHASASKASKTTGTTDTETGTSPVSRSSIEASMGLASDTTQPLFQRQNITLTRSKRVNKQLSPLSRGLPRSLRAGTPPSGHHRTSSRESLIQPWKREERYSPTKDMLTYYREDLSTATSALAALEESYEADLIEHLTVPDLAPVAAIFPESDSWWQSTLYAHLIAYNYVTTLNSALQSRRSQRSHNLSSRVPDKAARTMGIPTMARIEGMGEGGGEGEGYGVYGRVLEDLEKCMVRVMKSMMGGREGIGGLSSPGGVLGRGEAALVRALSAVVGMADV